MVESKHPRGESVRAAIAALPVSKERLADVMGVSTKTVERRLSGERDFRVREILAIARRLNRSVSSLMGEPE